MRVSAIIPTYNRAGLVCRAVESVLAQSFEGIEVVVVDDGSTDGTEEALERFGGAIRVVRQANQGVGAARNAGLAVAGGEFVAFLDSDDTWDPWKIGAQVAAMERFPDLVLCGTDAAGYDKAGVLIRERCLRVFYRTAYEYLSTDQLFDVDLPLREVAPDAEGMPEGRFRAGDFSSLIYLGNYFHMSTVMVRRSVLARSGVFDVRVGNAGEDYELFSRVVQHGRAGLLDVVAARCATGDAAGLSGLRLHTAMANWETMRKVEALRPGGLSIPAGVLAARRRAAVQWVGETLFDAERFAEARPYLRKAIAQGSRSGRVMAYLAMSYLPVRASDGLRWLKRAVR